MKRFLLHPAFYAAVRITEPWLYMGVGFLIAKAFA